MPSRSKKNSSKNLNPKQINNLLDRLYRNTTSGSAALYTSVEPLYREAHSQCKKINRNIVKAYLQRQHVYTRHRRAVRNRFKRLPTLAPGMHIEWQCDLADMQRLTSDNDGYAYILVCIDVLSRKLFARAVTSKAADPMIEAFKQIFTESGFVPWKILTDQGREFTSAQMQKFFTSLGISQYCMHTTPQFHAGMVERANRSLKERIFRYFTDAQTQRWIDVLPVFVSAINHSINSSIGMRPSDVSFENAMELRERLKNKASMDLNKKPYNQKRFKVGDMVRIERHKHVFKKGYEVNFTDEIFSVCEVRTTRLPITYRVVDGRGERLDGWFYAQDLSLVLPNDKHLTSGPKNKTKSASDADNFSQQPVWDIERIIKKGKRNGKDALLVRWKGLDAKHDSWIPAHSLIIRS